MLSSQDPSPFAASLAAHLAYIMSLPEFRTHVWAKLSAEARWRLYALRQQALVGDAPAAATRSAPPSSIQKSAPSASATTSTPTTTKTTPSKDSTASSVAWYDFNGRMRLQAWSALRGTMTALVATETFSAEMLAVLDAHPCPALLPLVESAVRRAAVLSCEDPVVPPASAANGAPSSPSSQVLRDRISALRHAYTPIDSSGAYVRESTSPAGPNATVEPVPVSPSPYSSSPAVVFVVRALQGDPAAVMLLWLCRAYGVPHEFSFEPLTSLVPATAVGKDSATSRLEVSGTPVVFSEAGDHFPFEASLRFGTAASSSRSDKRQPPATGREAVAEAAIVVTDPISAASLLIDTYLSQMPNWRGVPLALPAAATDTNATTSSSSAEARLLSAQARAVWLDDMRAITTHLRGPLMALQVDAVARDLHARFANDNSGNGNGRDDAKRADPAAAAVVVAQRAGLAGRENLLREAAVHLQRYEEVFVQRRVREAVAATRNATTKASNGTSTSTPSSTSRSSTKATPSSHRSWYLSLTETGAAQKLAQDYFSPSTAGTGCRLVSLVDLYTATCGYVLCTNALCQDLLPLRSPSVYQTPSVSPVAAAAVESGTGPVVLQGKRKVDLFMPTSSWAADGSFRSFPRLDHASLVPLQSPTAGKTETTAAASAPLIHLQGVSDRVNRLTNAVLRGETATPRRTTSPNTNTNNVAASRRLGTDSEAELKALRDVRTQLYPNSNAASLTEASLEMLVMGSQVSAAVAQLLRVRLCQCKEGLPVEDTDSSLTAFPVLVAIMTGAWTLSQAQLTGFPYLWLNPRFSYFLADLVAADKMDATSGKTKTPRTAPTRRNGADGFYVKKAPESPVSVGAAASLAPGSHRASERMAIGSWQSKLQDWWGRVGQSRNSSIAGKEEAPAMDERTQVLRHDGSQVPAAKL